MNKITRYIQNYLLYGFIFVVALLIWSAWIGYFSPHSNIADSGVIIRILQNLLSFNIMLWFVMLFLYMFFLVALPSFRDKALRRLANLQERDEREEYITGKSARASYVATLSLLLFFLVFSLININLSKLHQTDPKKPKHTLGIGFHYSFFNNSEIKKISNEQITTIFDSSEYLPSSATLILMLLGWQLLVFNFAARRERLKD
jgi:hypothetical protein